MIEQDEPQEHERAGHHHAYGQLPRAYPAHPRGSRPEGLDRHRHRIDQHDPLILTRHLRQRIHDGRRVHPQPDAEAYELPQVPVLGRERRHHHAETRPEGRELEENQGYRQSPPGGPHDGPRGRVVDIEGNERRQLNPSGKKIGKHLRDRRREPRKVHLAEKPRVPRKRVRRAVETGGEVAPEHRAAIVEQRRRYPVRRNLGQTPEDERVNDGREQRIQDEPQRSQDRLLVHRHEIPLHEEPHQVPVADDLPQVYVEPLPLGLDHERPVLLAIIHAIAHLCSLSYRGATAPFFRRSGGPRPQHNYRQPEPADQGGQKLAGQDQEVPRDPGRESPRPQHDSFAP